MSKEIDGDERARFEAHFKGLSRDIDFARDSEGYYEDLDVQRFWTGWQAALASNKAAAVAVGEPIYVPIATGSWEEVEGRHPNDKTPQDADCQKALNQMGDDRDQGLSSYWKWGFRSGWRAALDHRLLQDHVAATHPAAAQPSRAEVLTDAARDVLAERQRQITEKGHTVDDDAIYNDQGQMSYAAAGLAVLASEAATDIVCGLTGGLTYDDECIGKPEQWPHGWKYKPATPRRNLVVAAAFLIAEIERIDYVTEKP